MFSTFVPAIVKPHLIDGLLDNLRLVKALAFGRVGGKLLLRIRLNAIAAWNTCLIAIPQAVLQVLCELPVLADILLVLAALEAKHKFREGADLGLELATHLGSTSGDLQSS